MDKEIEAAFEEYLANVHEDAADDLIGLAEDAFEAGWVARGKKTEEDILS